jgi:hypothetical protein
LLVTTVCILLRLFDRSDPNSSQFRRFDLPADITAVAHHLTFVQPKHRGKLQETLLCEPEGWHEPDR